MVVEIKELPSLFLSFFIDLFYLKENNQDSRYL